MECTFGVLKKRFKALKNALLIESKEDINTLFFAACVFHNMLHAHDGRYERWGEDGSVDEADEIDEEEELQYLSYQASDLQWRLGGMPKGFSENEIPEGQTFKGNHGGLRDALVEHHEFLHKENRLKWFATSKGPGDMPHSVNMLN